MNPDGTPSMRDTLARPAHVRWMIDRDYPAVLAIDGCEVDSWGEADIRSALRRRSVIGAVAAVTDGETDIAAGFALYELRKHHLQLLRLVVHPADRGCGYGTALMRYFRRKIAVHRRERGYATVREDADAALPWLRSHGWRAVEYVADEFGAVGGVVMTAGG